jgi:hypothetical protein
MLIFHPGGLVFKIKKHRQIRSGIQDQQLAELVVSLRGDERLCMVEELIEEQEPKIICSLGLKTIS